MDTKIIVVRGKKFIVDMNKKVVVSVDKPRKTRKMDLETYEYFREMFKEIKR